MQLKKQCHSERNAVESKSLLEKVRVESKGLSPSFMQIDPGGWIRLRSLSLTRLTMTTALIRESLIKKSVIPLHPRIREPAQRNLP
jgi:hypothetical protein